VSEVAKINRCTDPTVGRFLLGYELDALSSPQVDLFERHLLACPHCREELTVFSPVASAMRRTGLPLLRAAERRQRSARRVPVLSMLWRPVAVSAAVLAAVVLFRFGPWWPAEQPLPQRSITFALTVPQDHVSNPDLPRSGFGLSGTEGSGEMAVFRYELTAGQGNG
jgi:hypothetical protein